MNKTTPTIETTIEGIKLLYNDSKKNIVSLIKYYLENHGKVLFFNTDNGMKDAEGNTYLSLALTHENILITYINKNGSNTTSDLNMLELNTIMSLPLFFRHTESKYSWVCEGIDGEWLEPCLQGFDSAEEAYQNMIDEAFGYARSIVADKERDEGFKFNVDIKFDYNVVTIENAFKYYIIQTE